jgi:tetratricopeptide (TPR) repeat protein
VTIFVKTGEKWRVEAHYPYSAVMGKYGEPPKMSWQRLGKDKFALLVEGGDMHQGYGSSYVSIYLLSEKELKTILNYVAEFDKDTYATISLVIGAVPSEGVSDIALSEERTDENSRKMQTIHQFRFANDKYEEIIKDTRESTVSISPLATAAPPAQTLNSLDQTVTKLLGFAGNPDESKIADVISAIEALPKPTKGDRKGARNLNEKALRLLQSGDPTGAISIFRQAVMADPSDQEVVNNLAYCYLQAERFTEAKRELGNTLLLAPRRSSAWANLGYLYAKTNDIPTAVRAFQHAYRFSSNQKKTLEYLHKQEDDQDSKVREATQLTLAAIGAQEKR